MSWHILVVDDDPAIRFLIRSHLQRRNMQVEEAGAAPAALARLARGGIDLLITDVHMPGPSGLWLLDQVRGRWADLPVILVTGDSAAGLARGAAAAVIVKPFTARDLMARVDALLGA